MIANGFRQLTFWMRRVQWPLECNEWSWSERTERKCIRNVMRKRSAVTEQWATNGVNTESVMCCLHWQVSFRTLIARPHRVKGYVSIWWHRALDLPYTYRLCRYFHPSIHRDCTSNGSSSQQPPAIMELCLNEQPRCPSTAPLLFSICLMFFFVPLGRRSKSSLMFSFYHKLWAYLIPQCIQSRRDGLKTRA